MTSYATSPPRRPPDGKKHPKDDPRHPQESPKSSPETPKSVQREAHDGPKTPPRASKRPQDLSRLPKTSPEKPPNDPKPVPRGPQTPSKRPPRDPKTLPTWVQIHKNQPYKCNAYDIESHTFLIQLEGQLQASQPRKLQATSHRLPNQHKSSCYFALHQLILCRNNLYTSHFVNAASAET